jgi:acyl dehydratase
MAELYYEDVDLGDELGPLERHPTLDTVRTFCELWGNSGPNRFVDPEIAQRLGQPGPIVPGVMSVALMSQLFTQWGPPQILKKIDVVFRQPVLHAPVKVVALVTDKREEDGENLVECDIHLTNLDGDRLVGGKVILSLPTRDG